MITEVKIGDKVSFRHKKKQVTGQVVHRHVDKEKAFLAGHVNVKIEGQPSYPVTVHVSKLKPVVKEEHTMENTVTVQDLLSHITSGNNVEAEQVLSVLLQGKVNELMSAAKVEVAQEMFNTQECAECEAEEVDEALKGKQHKIDANKNGKIDAQDFKMLRAKKGVKEEAEQIDELSPNTLQSYKAKATSDLATHDNIMKRKPGFEAKAAKRFKGIQSANAKMKEEVETLDEYQKGLFNPPAGFTKKGIEKGKGVKTTYNYASKKSSTPVGATMNLGGVKVNLGKKGMKKEEVEQVDEVSYSAKKAAAGKDIGKKGKSFKKIAASAGKHYGSKEKGQKVAGAILKKLRAKHGK